MNKFKVGDAIKAINNNCSVTNKYFGWEGVVVEISKNNFSARTTKCIKADVLGNIYKDLNYDDFELVKIDPVYNADTLITELINNNLNVFNKVDFTYKIEAKKPILDDVEKEYLKNVIKPFRDRIVYIKKEALFDQEYIFLYLGDDTMSFPSFESGTMYKGMKSNKHYTLKELEL